MEKTNKELNKMGSDNLLKLENKTWTYFKKIEKFRKYKEEMENN